MLLPYVQMPFLGIYSRETKACVHHMKTFTGVFIAALFIIAKNWKQMSFKMSMVK